MDLNNLTLFKMAGKRMDWVAQRQTVLASNIANVNTPDFMPSKIAPIDFSREIGKRGITMTRTTSMHRDMSTPRIGQISTNPLHLRHPSMGTDFYREDEVDRPFETSIDGNGVVLEEQLENLSQNRRIYKTVTAIYKKNINMIGASLGKNMQ